MSDFFHLSIYQTVGSGICVATEDGDKVFTKLKSLLEAGKKVEVSFKNVETLTTAFLNAAIGQLYGGDFQPSVLVEGIKYSDITGSDTKLVDLVVENAKLYFQNPAQHDKALSEALEE